MNEVINYHKYLNRSRYSIDTQKILMHEKYPQLTDKEIDSYFTDTRPEDIKVAIAVGDTHHPEQDQILINNILEYTRFKQPDYFIYGGDNMDCQAMSHWLIDKKQTRILEGKRLIKEYQSYNADILKPTECVLPEKCQKVWMEGNHENFISQTIDKNPQLEGYAEIENNLHLTERGWSFIPYGQHYAIGKLNFIHGVYTNKYHAEKTIDTYEKSIVSFHMHTNQTYTKITPLDSMPHTGFSMPCACKLNPMYAKDKPNAWVNGFTVIYFFPDGRFNVYPIIAINGSFVSPEGKVY